MKGDKLTLKQLKFVEFYKGNGVDAARKAGYKGNDKTLSVIAAENLVKPCIKEAIQKRQNQDIKRGIAGRVERLSILTNIIRDPGVDLRDKLKAIDQLSKCCGDYIQKVEMKIDQSLPQLLVEAEKRLDDFRKSEQNSDE